MFSLYDGTPYPPIGFGTYKITDPLTQGHAVDIIKTALSLGYRSVDTAAFYGNEKEIGCAVRESAIGREEIFVTTKVWKENLGYEKTCASIERSLELLDLSYIDQMLIHWPKEFPGDPDWIRKLQGSWKAMEEYHSQGLIRYLGLSNFLPHHTMEILKVARVHPSVDQLELHAGYMQFPAVLWHQQHEILVQAWSPLGRMRLSDHPAIPEMAARYGVSPVELLLRFLLQQGIAVIPKATSREHMLSNLHLKEFTISQEDMAFLLCLPPAGWGGEHPDFPRAAH